MVDISYVRNIGARIALEHLKKLQPVVEIEPLLSQSGLKLNEIYKENGWLPFYNHARFFELAAQALNDPFFALKLSREIDPREFGALMYVVISSKTLGDLLFNLKKYMRIGTGSWNIDILQQDELVILNFLPYHPDFFDYQVATEWFVSNLIRGIQVSIGRAYSPREIKFAAPPGDDRNLACYEEILGCKVSFGHQFCQVILDKEALEFPVKSADDRLLKILKSHCDQLLQEWEVSPTDFVGKVQPIIIDLLPGGRAKAKLVAQELGLTQRTMLRRLAEEGTSFSKILDTLRGTLAMKYIADQRLSLKQITYLLGYTNQSSFSAAFKRWKGCTPYEARMGNS